MFRPMIKLEYVNLDKMCRLCLVQTQDLVGIFTNEENCSLSLRIMACSALEVQQNDALPKSICVECRQLLEKFYFFRKKSKTSDSKLRRHLRLINAGKISKVFITSDDEDEDDDFDESRRLFQRWEHEKEAIETKARKLQIHKDTETVQKAIAIERAKFQSDEAVRISAELRSELEPAIRCQVEEELRRTLEPLMRNQIEKQIELVVKQKQVEEIRREVQEALKGQKEEMMNEYLKIQSMVTPKHNKQPQNVGVAVAESVHSQVSYDREDEIIYDEDPFKGSQHEISDEDMPFQDYEILFEADGTHDNIQPTTKTESSHSVANLNVDIDDDDISVHYQGEVEEDLSGDEQSYASNEPTKADKVGSEVMDQPIEEDLYIIGDTITEYLDDGDQEDDNMAADGDPATSANKQSDDINDSLRQTIENYTGVQMDANFKYKTSKKTKVEVVTDEGQTLLVEVVNDNQEQSDSLDENGEFKIFKCEKCPQAFARRFQLSRHMTTHDKRRGHMCDFCDKWFPSKSSLSRHTRTHTGEKPFKCTVCNRAFIQKEILRRHEITHTGNRPFACEHCDKAFTQREVLRQHINRNHTESPIIDLHKCPKCPKSFLHASGLSRHILVHSGRKFHCEHCDKPFSDKSALKRHVNALHPPVEDF